MERPEFYPDVGGDSSGRRACDGGKWALKAVGALRKVHSSSLKVEGGSGGSGFLSIFSTTGEGCRSITVDLDFDQETKLSGTVVAVREERGERWSWLSVEMAGGGRDLVRRRRGRGRCQVAGGR